MPTGPVEVLSSGEDPDMYSVETLVLLPAYPETCKLQSQGAYTVYVEKVEKW